MANKTFDKYVHKIGKFWLEGKDDIPFAAQIVCTNSFNYELVGSMIKHDSITEIRRQQSELRGVTLFGVVEGNHISLFNCRIECSSGGADNAKNKFQYYLNCMPVVSTELWPVPSFCLRYDLLKRILQKY